MSKKEESYLDIVWNKIKEFDYESPDWTKMDESMYKLECLTDTELFREADVLLTTHTDGNPNCGVDHPSEECYVPKIILVVSNIINIYNDIGILTPKQKYILQFYLAISHDGQILY